MEIKNEERVPKSALSLFYQYLLMKSSMILNDGS